MFSNEIENPTLRIESCGTYLLSQAEIRKREEALEDRKHFDTGVDPLYQIPDELWNRIKVLLPILKPKKKSGRPRMDDRKAMNGVFYVLRTGCQWKALPRSLGAPSTVHDRFQEWRQAGLFKRLWREGLIEYDVKEGLDWKWQSIDGWMEL